MIPGSLAGRRILLVEDEVLVAMLLEAALEDEGAIVVGPCARLSEAVRAARVEAVDGALLDVNLGGERVYPAADLLESRAIPFLLLSGYGIDAAPADRPHWLVHSKPFRVADVIARLAGLLHAHV